MNVQKQIREILRPLGPDEIIIFGSRGQGRENLDSDIDLIVVLPTGEPPKNYSEKMANDRQVRRLLADINREYALDLMVFTRPEWTEFKEKRPLFATEILNKGRRIA